LERELFGVAEHLALHHQRGAEEHDEQDRHRREQTLGGAVGLAVAQGDLDHVSDGEQEQRQGVEHDRREVPQPDLGLQHGVAARARRTPRSRCAARRRRAKRAPLSGPGGRAEARTPMNAAARNR
jgi:hypothetical protein